jgi:sialate O-acetylesterase
MNTTKINLLIAILLLLNLSSFAKITLPSVFSDNMVMQQNAEVAIWGWTIPSGKVQLVASWSPNDTIVATAANNAFWSTKIKTIQAGGPYTLTILGGDKVVLSNVMLGEVWVCSGQSNMEWSVNSGITNGEQEAAQANHPNIRIFQIPKISAAYPQQDCKATWTTCTPETMRATSAIGYFFARELQKNLDVPIGIIVSAWGGSIAEAWFKKELFESDAVILASFVEVKAPWAPAVPASIYHGMITPILPYGIAGALWYQGESNATKPESYSHLMRTLIESWRQDFGKEFPFYYVQIAPYAYGSNDKAYLVREQQTKALEIPRTGMVVVSDLVEDVKNIHPKNKLDVGKRLANWALAETYGKKIGAYKSPLYQSMKVEKNRIRVYFANAENGLKSTNKTIPHIQIAGEDRRFVEASAEIKGNTLVVSNKTVKNPVAVRFCFDNAAISNVFSQEGLPVAPFRTDNWEVETATASK